MPLTRKYLKSNQLPSEIKKDRHWKTHQNIFTPIWLKIEDILSKSPKLQATTIYLFSGFTGVMAFVLHAFFGNFTAGLIGWTNSTFQYEVTIVNLSIATLRISGF